MDNDDLVSDVTTENLEAYNNLPRNKRISKICKECKKDLLLSEFSGDRGKCKACYNLERKIKCEEKTKEIKSIKQTPISLLFINHIDLDSHETICIQSHLEEIENLSLQDKEIRTLLFLLDNLDENRVKDLASWIIIGRLFYSIYLGTTIGLNAWIEYSTNYDIDTSTCNILYKTFKTKTKITIRTLFYFLKLDKPDFWKRYHEILASTSYAKCLQVTNKKIAAALYNTFYLDFYYCRVTTNWYYFNGNILIKDNKNIYFKTFIDEKFIPIFERILIGIQELTDITQKEKDTQTILFNTLIKNLETNTFINQCIDASCKLFNIENINKYLDSDHCIISLSNGILEIIPELCTVIPRNPIPEDYITKQTNVIYNSSMSFDHPHMKLLLTWLHQLFPYEDLFEYVIKICSSFLVGKNISKKFYIFTGKSNGGKSSFCKLLEQTFGMYYATVSSSFLDKTMNSNSGGPSPELMQVKGAHIVMVPEVDDTIPLSSNKIKKLTGSDRMYARNCNSDGEVFDSTFATGMCCNGIPPCDNIDIAIMSRLQVVIFLSEYRENVEDDYEKHIFRRNNNFETEILPYLIEPFLWLLVEKYPTFAKEGIKNCKTIIDYTEKYFMESDQYLRFKNDRLDVMDDSYVVGISDLYTDYLCWFNQNYPGKPKATKSIVTRELNRILGDSDGRNMWFGYAIKT